MASGRKERIISRRKLSLELREAGLSYRDIATTLGQKGYPCTHVTAYKDVQAILAEQQTKTAETGERVKEIELSRLNTMLKSIWSKVLKGDVASIDRALRIQERRAKLLGLDAATKHEVENNLLNIVIKKPEGDDIQ